MLSGILEFPCKLIRKIANGHYIDSHVQPGHLKLFQIQCIAYAVFDWGPREWIFVFAVRAAIVGVETKRMAASENTASRYANLIRSLDKYWTFCGRRACRGKKYVDINRLIWSWRFGRVFLVSTWSAFLLDFNVCCVRCLLVDHVILAAFGTLYFTVF